MSRDFGHGKTTVAAERTCAPGGKHILMADTCVQPWKRSPAFEGNLQSFPWHRLWHAFPETSVPLEVPRFAPEPVAVSPPKPPQAAASSGGHGGTACPGRLAPDRATQPDRGRSGPQVIVPTITVLFVRSGRRSVQRSGDRRPACSWPEPSRWRSWRRKKSR